MVHKDNDEIIQLFGNVMGGLCGVGSSNVFIPYSRILGNFTRFLRFSSNFSVLS